MTKQFKLIKQQAFRRDNYTCQRCFDETKKVEIHHIIPRRSGGSDELDNLITYCRKCHKIIEPSHIIRRLSIIAQMDLIIKVSDLNHTRLQEIGRMTDTMDDVVGQLLDWWDSTHKEAAKRK